jgi:hypothetical protein
LLTGCSLSKSDSTTPVVKVDPNIVAAIKAVFKTGATLGLAEWAKTDPAAEQECAKSLGDNLTTTILPYMKDKGTILSSKEVEAFLQSSLCDKLPPVVKTALIAAFAVLDFYLPIPDAKTYLNASQVQVITACLTGINEACAGGAASRSNAPAVSPTVSLQSSSTIKWFAKSRAAK